MSDLRRIAIVNRGEPAIRFLRALRDYNLEHGTKLEAVALYTDPDEDSPFVRLADDTVHLGPAMRPSADGSMVSAYVHHEALLAALQRSRCDAVWPGWGFVSEDPTFVTKLETAGITFLGPSAKAMHMLGDKIAAKELAERCEVPLAPWSKLDLDDDAITLGEKAREVGYPLMVKASAGGGGRGIRRVNRPEDLAGAVNEVRDEVKKIFGQGTVFIERCISGARHIEVQLVVGADGNATALGIRDCSIQRRNQKVIEEAPSPVVPDKTVARLGAASVRLAEAANYRGVATAEYLYDPAKDRATFLEVNSRLQVEHTVTECITGCDLVQAQIDIARGLPWVKPVGPPRGHAIEVRLNAEDPEQGFAPRPGHIRVLRPPSGPGMRFDSGVAEGMVVAPEFDSMIAKVIATGATRKQAIARLERGLRELEVVVEDGATNKAFLLDLLREEAFLDGSADTAWLDREMAAGGVIQTRHHFEALFFAAIVEYRRRRHGHIHEFFAQTQNGVPQHPPTPEPLTVDLKLRGQAVGLSVYGLADDKYLVGQPGALHLLTAESTGTHSAVLHVGGHRHSVMYVYGRTGIGVEIDGAMHTVELASGGIIKAPVPAVVVHVAVQEGDKVQAGDRLLTLEAMKLEMPLFAPEAGTVRAILCTTNQQLTVGQDIIVLDPEGTEEEAPTSTLREALPIPESGPLQQLFHGDFPSLVEIDEMSDRESTSYVDAVLKGIQLMFLGYDTDETLWASLGVLLAAATSNELADLKHPERWVRLATLPAVYADTGALFDRSLTPGGSATSAQMSFYATCRRHQEGEDGVPEAFLPLLKRGLRHYAVHSLEPDADLREALWRLTIVHAHSRARHRLCSQLLRAVVALRDIGVTVERHHRLREALARITRILGVKQSFVADNARQALYVLFRQPRYQHRQAEV
ncbi:MAG: acetyl/propionyl-CoA carboxylase alpha subunit, partial [Myxococcota bacterium]